jgi:hypothetical protein
MAVFVESGMIFDLPDENVFLIERSEFVKHRQGLSSVECVCLKGKRLLLIEAKSSFPRAENNEAYSANINEIAEKFIHSFEVFLSHIAKVNLLIPEAPDKSSKWLANYDFSKRKPIVFVLIVNCTKINKNDMPTMIGAIQDRLSRRLKWHKGVWNTDFIALDHESAIERELIVSLEE